MNTPPDAGMSLLGTFGLRNPVMVWLLNRRPDLLAETPKELTWEPGTPPVCGTDMSRANHGWEKPGDCEGDSVPYVKRPYEPCGRRMVFRYVHNRPAWVCYAHDDEAQPNYPYRYIHIERPTPKMQTLPDFDLFAAIGASLDGASLDLRWDDREGKWAMQEMR